MDKVIQAILAAAAQTGTFCAVHIEQPGIALDLERCHVKATEDGFRLLVNTVPVATLLIQADPAAEQIVRHQGDAYRVQVGPVVINFDPSEMMPFAAPATGSATYPR
ncbi:hypothetical protein [Spirosoma sordidisoli]|uniref:Uncharacterized protein n=1 Tax=Spirosoma sordidisoli TaxID=2502893 RepID=A0A4Q2UBC4_9BACT|nr:hypothetical protein [Spirosoma sordidisoli]RYC66323.1 hypothetical protein EQG79_30065 [Spirosoma sordidisoli]